MPFHCHDCETPTMNKNGLCDKHQPEVKIKKIDPIDFYVNPEAKTVREVLAIEEFGDRKRAKTITTDIGICEFVKLYMPNVPPLPPYVEELWDELISNDKPIKLAR